MRKIGDLADFSAPGLIGMDVDGTYIVIGNVDGRLYAMDGRCSHMRYDLAKGKLQDHVVTCKLHGAEFDLRDGKVLRNLSAKDLRSYPVIVKDDGVYLDL